MREVAVVSKSSPFLVVGADHDRQPGSGTTEIIHLSSFDKSLAPLPVTVLLVFDRPIKDPVESIKNALSRSLAVGLYHPMSGRLSADGGAIACTGQGVSFVGASASCALEDYLSSLSRVDDQLAVGYPADWCRPEDPLVLMQVTEFACGGFVVGATWSHVMADGAGMAQFLRAVGGFAVGASSPSSVVPLRTSSVLPCLPPSMVAANRAMMAVASKEMARLEFTVPSGLIARIKAQWAEAEAHERPCTVFEAVTALLWQCRTRAMMDGKDEDEPAALIFARNVRRILGAEDGYYGNCLSAQLVRAPTSGAVASSGINGLVKLVKRAKDSGGDQEQPLSGSGAAAAGWYGTLLVSSWRNLGFEAAEFGGRTPARVMWHQRQTVAPICVLCPPCEGKDGVNVMSMCVRPEHADAFLAALHAYM